MKKLYDFLRIVQWSFLGVFLGSSLYTCWDHKARPGLYAMRSAPWYLDIQLGAVFTGVVVAVILLLRWAIRRKLGKK